MKLLRNTLTAVALALAAAGVAAQSWPAKPIRWVVPYTPGGITDNVTRMVVAKVSAAIGQPITVENKPGANSIIGVDQMSKSAPDGYTFATVIAAHAANATLYEGRLPFDHKAIVPVSLVAISPIIMTASNQFPARDLAELIAFAKANPGKVTFGSSGVGAAAHLTSELLAQTAGIQMTHVPYKGTAPALTDLIAGNLMILADTPSSMMPHVRSGKVRALAMFSASRLSAAPEVPTAAEAGGPALESSTWVMFLAPPGTPRDIVDRLSKAVAEVVRSPEISGRFNELGIIPGGMTPAESAKFLSDEVTKWARVIRAGNVRID